jgi:fibronectin-binding autotransporter adhesin
MHTSNRPRRSSRLAAWARVVLAIVAGLAMVHATPASAQTTVGGSTDSTFSTNVTSGSLTKIGSNTVTLTGSNTYAGGTFITQGILSIAGGTNIGTGTVAMSAGTGLTVNSSAAVSLANALSVGPTGLSTLLKQSSGDLQLAGSIVGGGTAATLYLNTTAADSATTFTLSGSNSFQGRIHLNRGSLIVNNANALGNTANEVYLNSYVNTTVGNLRFAVSGTFANPINNADAGFDNTIGTGANDVTLAGSIYGAGGLTKYGTGRLVITGSNTYANGTTVASGTLQVGNGGATGQLGSGGVSNAGALVFNRSGSLTVGGVISGTGSLTQAGPGTITLTGNNTFTGTTTITAGTLEIGNGGTGGILSGTSAVTNNGTLAFNRSDNVTVSRAIVGSGGLVKRGGGSLTLTGTNTYAGTTTVNAGTLVVAGTANLPSGNVSFTGPGGFTVTGTAVTFANNFDLGSVSGTVTLTTPSASSTVLNGVISGGAAGTTLFFTNDISTSSGILTLNGSNTFQGTLNVFRSPVVLGNANAAGSAAILLNANNNAGGDLQFGSGGFTIANNVQLANPGMLNWIGVSSGQTNGIAGVISGNGLTKVGAGTLVLAGDNSYSGGTTFTSGTVQVGNGGAAGSLGSGAVSNGGVLVFNRSGSVTVGGIISGTGSVTQAGPGTTVLTAGNTYSGATTISSGTLQVGNGGSGSALGGSGTITNNGALVFNIGDSQTLSRSIVGTGGLSKAGAGTLTLGGTNTYSGGTTISGGTLTVAGTSSIGSGQVRFTAPSTLTLTSSTVTFNNAFDLGSTSGTITLMVSTTSSTVINGPITGGGANTTIMFNNPVGGANTGVLTLNGTNSFQGNLLVYRGPLVLGNALAAGVSTLQLNGNNNPLGDLQFNSGFTIGNDVQLVNGGVANWIGVPAGQTNGISGVISGNGFTKIGAGTLVLAADNSYSGGTTFTSGTVQVGNGGAAGSLGSGEVSNGGALVFNRSGALTAANTISGTGSLTQAGPGTTVLTGNNSYTGGTTLAGGFLNLGSSNAIGSSGTISFDGGALQYSASNTTDYSGRFSNAAGQQYSIDTNGQSVTLASNLTSSGGSFTKLGSGSLTLSGTNSYTGGTVVSAGRLIGTVASLQGAITNNAVVEFAQATSGTYAGSMSGSGSLTKTGVGTLTLSGTNSYAAGTTVAGGRVVGTTDSLQGAITNNAAVDFTQAASGTYAGAMSGSGSLTKTGAGTVILAGSNTYSGTTTITAGGLQVGDGGGTGSLGSGAVVNNASLIFNRNNALTVANVISGSGSVTQSGPGTTTLTAANSYTGGTTIDAGVLATSAADRLAAAGSLTVNAAGTFQLGGNQTLASIAGAGSIALGSFTLSTGSSSSTFAGSIAGDGGLTKIGPGTLTLSGSNSFTGDTDIQAGTVVLSSSTALASDAVVTMQSGAVLTVNQRTFISALDQGGGTVNGPGTLVSTLTLTNSGSLNAVLADGPDFAAGILKRTSGTTMVGAANTFTGSVKVQGGTLQLSGSGSFDAASKLVMSGGATMDLNGKSQAFSSITGIGGTVALGSGVLTVNSTSAEEFGGSITGSGGLVKQGVGNLILAGSSSYTGATTVSAGRLSVNGALGASPVMVLAAAELGGSGSIGGSVTVQNGGTLSPGNSIASLAAGATSFASGATFEYEVNSSLLGNLAAAADLLVVNGNLDIASGSLLTFTDLAGGSAQPFVNNTTIFAMINYTGAWNSGLFTYDGNELADGERFLAGSQLWEIDYNRTSSTGLANFTSDYVSGNFVAVTAVPEPSTLMLLGIGGVLAGFVASRRR